MSTPKTLHGIFEARAAEAPDRLAVDAPDAQLTYGELDARANRLALKLRGLGVGPDVLVGLCADRGAEMIVGLLAILKANGAYVPIDPTYPRKRVEFLLADSAAGVVVTTPSAAQALGDCQARIVYVGGGEPASPAADDTRRPAADEAGPNNLAYIIYTSGSTGAPKGVPVEHHNVTRLFEQTHPWFGFDERDVWTLFHSMSFDFSVWEIWGALLYGGRLVVVPYEVSRSPSQFLSLLADRKVTVLNQTPSAFRQLIAADVARGGPSDLALRHVIFGGEALDVKMLGTWVERYGDERPALANMYGITETTVHVTYKRLRRDDLTRPDESPIGVPIPDLQLYLLDSEGRPVPDGSPGELYVGGEGLARGYLNRPELTAERFVLKPEVAPGGARLYATGDRAARLPDGGYAYLGRADDQLKVRGFRIEPREIEVCLGAHPAVSSALVSQHDYGDGDVRLVAHVIPGPGLAPDEQAAQALSAELADRAAAELPAHMRPSAYFVLEELPLTPHGKVDREALRQTLEQRRTPEQTSGPNGGARAGLTPTEQTVLAIWEDVLQREGVGTKDDFFDLGGTSLALIRIFGQVNRRFDVSLDPGVLVDEATVACHARSVEARLQADGVQTPGEEVRK